MSNKTLTAIAVICVITIVFSGFNSYLILNNFRVQQEQLSELKNAVDKTKNSIGAVESVLSSLNNQINILNQSMFTNITEFKTAVRTLDSNLKDLAFNVSNLERTVDRILQQTPANIYEKAHKSVVVITTPRVQGSGFLYSPNLILTNWHVVRNETDIEIKFYDGTTRKASVAGTDPYSDVAVLMISSSPPDAKPLPLGNSSKLWVGQQVVAIGNPLGLTGSLSSGYISQINKLIEIISVPIMVPVLQLDITIAPGSSGGPLLDLSGNVVGITNAGTLYGFNFAVPSNIVKRAVSSIIEKGYYRHPYVGFKGVELNPETIRELNILNVESFQTGLLILEVIPDTPAAEVRLRAAVQTQAPDGSPAYIARDIILAVDDHPTLTQEEWAAYVEEYVSPGQSITLTLWRSGEIVSIAVTTTYRPPYLG